MQLVADPGAADRLAHGRGNRLDPPPS